MARETFGATNSIRCLEFQNGNKQDASFANQRGALHFGLAVRVSSCKAAGDFAASKCQVHANGFSMLVRDKFAPPVAGLLVLVVEPAWAQDIYPFGPPASRHYQYFDHRTGQS